MKELANICTDVVSMVSWTDNEESVAALHSPRDLQNLLKEV